MIEICFVVKEISLEFCLLHLVENKMVKVDRKGRKVENKSAKVDRKT